MRDYLPAQVQFQWQKEGFGAQISLLRETSFCNMKGKKYQISRLSPIPQGFNGGLETQLFFSQYNFETRYSSFQHHAEVETQSGRPIGIRPSKRKGFVPGLKINPALFKRGERRRIPQSPERGLSPRLLMFSRTRYILSSTWEGRSKQISSPNREFAQIYSRHKNDAKNASKIGASTTKPSIQI